MPNGKPEGSAPMFCHSVIRPSDLIRGFWFRHSDLLTSASASPQENHPGPQRGGGGEEDSQFGAVCEDLNKTGAEHERSHTGKGPLHRLLRNLVPNIPGSVNVIVHRPVETKFFAHFIATHPVSAVRPDTRTLDAVFAGNAQSDARLSDGLMRIHAVYS
jgi:hypothetical protein